MCYCLPFGPEGPLSVAYGGDALPHENRGFAFRRGGHNRANPNGKSLGKTALHNAAIFGRTEIVRLLVSCEDIDLNAQEDGTAYTALHHAVHHERYDIISVLLKHGIRSDIKDCVGNTALDLANHFANKSMTVLLQDAEKTG
jgi:ankyrin repeat protein